MNLPFFSKRAAQSAPKAAIYFALRITSHQVLAALWQSDGQASKLVATSSWADWDPQQPESLVKQIDGCLAELPSQAQNTNQVLFGIPASWVHNQQLLSEQKDLLKQITHELDLKALGYAVTSEAMVNYLNILERAPVAAIVVGLEPHQIEVCLSVQGKVQQIVTQERVGSLTDCLFQVLKDWQLPQLPARIVLFDGKEPLPVLQSELMHYDWEQAQVGFLHLPKVDIYQAEQTLEALIQATGQGAAALPPSPQPQDDAVSDDESETDLTSETDLADESAQEGTVAEEPVTEENPAVEEEGEPEVDPEDHPGLIAADEDPEAEAGLPHAAPAMPVAGFVIGQDIREVGDKLPSEMPAPVETLESNVSTHRSRLRAPESIEHTPITEGTPTQKPSRLKMSGGNRKWQIPRRAWQALVLLIAVVAIGAIGMGYLVSSSSAQVTLSVKPQMLENNFNITVDPKLSDPDIAAGRLPGNILTAQTSGAKNMTTTGKKTVGESAKGEVNFFNDAESERTLDAGTVLTSSGGLKFTLDEKVKIASKSVDLASDTPFKPGTGKGKVTASQFGTEYNLEANSTFTVANFSQSSVLARSTAAFTGGSSREVQSVSADDQEELLIDLQAELEVQAQEKLNKQLPDGFQLITSSITASVVKKAFDQKVGDMADKLSLDLNMKFTGVSYSKSQIDELVKQQLANRIPLDKQFAQDGSMDFKMKDSKNDIYNFEVITKSPLLPKLNPDNIKAKLAGKRPDAVKGYLFSLPSVSQVKFEIRPKLPSFLGFLNRFPFKTEKIDVKVVAEG